MRLVLSATALAGLLLAGCATQKTYETVLDVCSSGNGTVKTATVTKSSGDAELDKHAVEKVSKSLVYEESTGLNCRPVTVEYKVTGAEA